MTVATEREVEWSLDGITMHATVTRPEGSGPHPAVVLVAGSGPTDRNWNSPLLPGSNGSGALLAAALVAAGFVCLRYDKRASGPHARENLPRLAGLMSFHGHRDELAAAVTAVLAEPSVDARRVALLTNSEGALHALTLIVSEPGPEIAALVLTAPPGRPVGEVAHDQLARQLAGLPDAEGLLRRYDAAVARFVAGEAVEPDPALPEAVQQLLASITAPINQPLSRELWTVDPAHLLRQVTMPVLVVIGQRDLQVDWRIDGERLRAAAGPAVTFAFPEYANHVLKREMVERSSLDAAAVGARYNAATSVLDDDAWVGIRTWLTDQLAPGPARHDLP